MKLNYKPISEFIKLVDKRNTDNEVDLLLGLSISKQFIPSVANTIGTDMTNYKVILKNQFACSLMQVRRDKKMPVALLTDFDEAIISQAYPVFEIIDEEELLPEYLMMWFSRSEFDRHACFLAVGGVRGSLEWNDFLEMELPVPSTTIQREIVKEYNTIIDRIKLNEQLNQKLEETAQALYKYWFVDFEFPDENGNPYKSSGGEMEYNVELNIEIPKEWKVEKLEKSCSKIGSGSTPRGGKDSYKLSGKSLVRSLNVYDFSFSYKDLAFIDDTQAKKLDNVTLEEKDILLNITGVSVARCCIIPSNVLPGRVNQHVSIIRIKPEIGDQFYFFSALCSSNYKSRLLGMSEAGSTRQAITKTDIEKLDILIPVKKIRNQFHNEIEVLFNHRTLFSDEIENLKIIKDLLLAKLVNYESLKVSQPELVEAGIN